MNALLRFLDRISNWKTLLLLLVMYVSFPAYWLKNAGEKIDLLAGKPMGPIDLTQGFDPPRTLGMVADYGPAARAYYAQVESSIDLIYPLVYAFLLAVVLTLLYRRKPYKPFDGVALLPFVIVGFDYLENATIIYLLNSFPIQSGTVAILCEFSKLGKWICFVFVILFVLYGLIRLVLGKIQTSTY